VRKFGLFAFIVLLLPARAGAEIPPSTEQLVIVDGINFTTNGLPKSVHERERFFAVLNQKLREKGWNATTPIAESLCSPARDCLGYIAQQSHAPYVLHVTGEGNLKIGYSLRLQLYSAATKRSQRTNTFCEICVTDGIASSTADLALGLLADAARDDEEVSRNTRESQLTASSVAPAPLTQPRRLSWIPWSMIGAGALGLGIGVWALYEDGETSGDSHATGSTPLLVQDHHASKAFGLISLAAGGALAATGILWLARTPSATATVAVSPKHIAFSLRY